MRPMQLRQLFPLLAAFFCLSACGGSGSTGFDIIAPSAENAVIEEVLASGTCGESGDVTICPASVPTQTIPGNPAPTPGGRDVQLEVPESDALPCAVVPATDSCVLTVFFLSTGLPADARYRLAVRSDAEGAMWEVTAPAELSGAFFAVPLDFPTAATEIQVAVLVFTGEIDVPPGPVETLAETGAAFAFVSEPIVLRPGG